MINGVCTHDNLVLNVNVKLNDMTMSGNKIWDASVQQWLFFLLGEGGMMFWGILGVCFFQELGNTDMLIFLFKHI